MGSTRSEQLDRSGYIVVEDVLDQKNDLQPILDEYAQVLDRLATTLHRDRKISRTYAELPFGPRLTRITKEYGSSLSQYFDFALPMGGIHPDTPMHHGQACFRLLTNQRLLDLAEEFIGPEILVSPIGHVRIKLPEGTLNSRDGLASQVPWHQDGGVVLDEADQSNVLTLWVAINDATIDNGCMQVVPCDRESDLIRHCTSYFTFIPDTMLEQDKAVQLPMKAGSVLLMHPKTVHSSLGNTTTDQIRISMDLRYQPIGEPTGRPMFPAFIGRSRANPDLEVRDHESWSQMWLTARTQLAHNEPGAFNRWDPNSPLCA